MRKLVAMIGLGLAAIGASAQVLPQGSTPDAVARALGTPRSRSATKDREIWLYPTHQVVFENGRLISLLALPTEGGTVEWQKRPSTPIAADGRPTAPSPSGVPAGNSSSVRSPRASSAAVAVDPKATKAIAPVMVTSEAGRLVLRSPERRPPPAPPRSSLVSRVMWPLFVIGLVGSAVIGIRAVWRRSRKRRAGQAMSGRISENVSPGSTNPNRSRETTGPLEVQGTHDADENATRDTPALPVSRPPSLTDGELTPVLLREMEWRRFELIVERYYAASGFRTKAAGVGADDGVDIYLYRGGAQRPMSCVQCKACGTRRVDVARVRELFGVMAVQKVPEGVFVTTGAFTSDALTFGRQSRVTLLAGDEFIARFNRLPQIVRQRILAEITDGDYTTPSCPRCRVKLVLRLNQKDQSAFWACQRYPRCHYTMRVQDEPECGVVGNRGIGAVGTRA